MNIHIYLNNTLWIFIKKTWFFVSFQKLECVCVWLHVARKNIDVYRGCLEETSSRGFFYIMFCKSQWMYFIEFDKITMYEKRRQQYQVCWPVCTKTQQQYPVCTKTWKKVLHLETNGDVTRCIKRWITLQNSSFVCRSKVHNFESVWKYRSYVIISVLLCTIPWRPCHSRDETHQPVILSKKEAM